MGNLSKLVPYVDIHDTHLRISDVLIDGHWNLAMLYTQLPQQALENIQGLSVTLSPDVDDAFIWIGRLDGTYSAKAGYDWLLTQRHNNAMFPGVCSWKWIWQVPGPEKIKFLIWTTCHNAIPTSAMLHHRGMLNSAICQRCRSGEETVLHCLRDCSYSRNIWNSLRFDSIAFYHITNPMDWIKYGICGDNPHLFLATVWWLWRARNSSIIANEPIPSYELKMTINNFASLLHSCFAKAVAAHCTPRLVMWHPTRDNEIILNVDGSSIGNPGRSGFGGLLRRYNGEWLCGFAGNIGISNNLHAELSALYNGLLFAWNRGYRSLVCYSDSQNVLQLVVANYNKWNRFAPLIQKIKIMLRWSWQVQLLHTLREGNACADHLAKIGAAADDKLIVFDTPPPDISPLLQADAQGVEFVRR